MSNLFTITDKHCNAVQSEIAAQSRKLLTELQIKEFTEVRLYAESQAQKRVEIVNSLPAGKNRKKAVKVLQIETIAGIKAIQAKYRVGAAVKQLAAGEIKGTVGKYFFIADLTSEAFYRNHQADISDLMDMTVGEILKNRFIPESIAKKLDLVSLQNAPASLTLNRIRQIVQGEVNPEVGVNLESPGQVLLVLKQEQEKHQAKAKAAAAAKAKAKAKAKAAAPVI